MDRLEKVHKDEPRPGKLQCDERLRGLGSFSFDKRRLRGNLITMFQFLKSGYKEDGGSHFTNSNIEKMRENSDSTQKEFLFSMTTFTHWNNPSSGGFSNIRHFRSSRKGCWAVSSRL